LPTATPRRAALCPSSAATDLVPGVGPEARIAAIAGRGTHGRAAEAEHLAALLADEDDRSVRASSRAHCVISEGATSSRVLPVSRHWCLLHHDANG
jgi:hypothetical protein